MTFRHPASALLVIDAQDDMLRLGARTIDPPIQVQAAAASVVELIDHTRRTDGMPIVHVAKATEPSRKILFDDGQKPHVKPLCFIKGAEPQGHEALLVKSSDSAFSDPKFAVHLKEWGINSLYMVGFHTSACVQMTAFDAVKSGFNVYVVEGATYSRSADRTEDGLKAMQEFGVSIIGIEDFKKLIWPENPIIFSEENPHCQRPDNKPKASQLVPK